MKNIQFFILVLCISSISYSNSTDTIGAFTVVPDLSLAEIPGPKIFKKEILGKNRLQSKTLVKVYIIHPPVFITATEAVPVNFPCTGKPTRFLDIEKKVLKTPGGFEEKEMPFDEACNNCYWGTNVEKVEELQVPAEYMRVRKIICTNSKYELVTEMMFVKPETKTYRLRLQDGSFFTVGEEDTKPRNALQIPDFSGLWKNSLGEVVEFQPTANGFKACNQSQDPDHWFDYQNTDYGIYADAQGNRYMVRSQKDLDWLSANGAMLVSLTRSSDPFPINVFIKGHSQSGHELRLDRRYTHALLPNDSLLPLMEIVEGKPVWSLMNMQTGNLSPLPFEGFEVHDHTFLWRGKMVAQKDGKWGVAAPDGKVVLPFEYAEIKINAPFPWFIRKGTLWGILDNDWKVITAPRYVQIGYVSQSEIPAALPDGQIGILDEKGEVVMPFGFYATMTRSSDGDLQIVQNREGKSALFNLKLRKWMLPFENQGINFQGGPAGKSTQVVLFGKGGKTGMADASGTVLIAPKYECINWADDDLAAFGTAKLTDEETGTTTWHILNAKGEMVGVAPVGSRWVNRVYDHLASFKDKNGNYGFIKIDGSVAIEPAFLDAQSFRENLAMVTQTDGSHSIINKQGEILHRYPYPHVSFDYYLRYAAFSEDGKKYGLMDREGNVIMPISEQFNGYFKVNEMPHGVIYFDSPNGKRGAIRLDGSMVFEPIYDVIQYYEETGDFTLQKGDEVFIGDFEGKILPKTPESSNADDFPFKLTNMISVNHEKYGKSIFANKELALFKDAGQLVLVFQE